MRGILAYFLQRHMSHWVASFDYIWSSVYISYSFMLIPAMDMSFMIVYPHVNFINLLLVRHWFPMESCIRISPRGNSKCKISKPKLALRNGRYFDKLPP